MCFIERLTFPAELPSPSAELPWRVGEEEVGLRRDLRPSHLIFSIDPRGCEDVDDTLSVRWAGPRNKKLGQTCLEVASFPGLRTAFVACKPGYEASLEVYM